jgi:hypothetical protein
MWLAAFILTVAITTLWKGDYQPERLHEYGLPVTVLTQRLQCFLTALELVLVGSIALKGHLIARTVGDPQNWRPATDREKVCLEM